MQTERRKHPRYKVRDNVFAVISPDPVKVVPIMDISMGGLSIYLDNGSRGPDPVSKLEIMVADCSFYLENLPFQIVGDVEAFPNSNSKADLRSTTKTFCKPRLRLHSKVPAPFPTTGRQTLMDCEPKLFS